MSTLLSGVTETNGHEGRVSSATLATAVIAALAPRVQKWTTMLAAIGGFAFVVWDPTVLRIVAVSLGVVLVHLPIWFRREGR